MFLFNQQKESKYYPNSKAPNKRYQFVHQLDQHELKYTLSFFLFWLIYSINLFKILQRMFDPQKVGFFTNLVKIFLNLK